MASHWTYRDIDSEDADLEQGDIIFPSDALRALLKSVHPHFDDDKYVAFVVLTQTCDLVRRGRDRLSKASYITLAPVRPLAMVMPKLLQHVSKPVKGNFFRKSHLVNARELLERVFNQNEQSIGIFFLHPDADISLGVESVALLRITVTVKSSHYQLLTAARTGRLREEFQAKLGWLLGNLYNRPATPDWNEYEGGSEQLKKLINRFAQPEATSANDKEIGWIDDVLVDIAQKLGKRLEDLDLADLETLRPSPVLDRALEAVRQQVETVFPELEKDGVQKLLNRLRNNGKFTKLLTKEPIP